MTTYKTDGGTATLTTAANYDGTTWNGFAVPRATATEVAKYIDDVVAQDGVDREDMEDVFADLELGDEPVALDGIMWEVTDATEADMLNMTQTERPMQFRTTIGNGDTLTVERNAHADEWMVATFNGKHDVIAKGVTRDEAEAVARVLIDGGTRTEAQRAGQDIHA